MIIDAESSYNDMKQLLSNTDWALVRLPIIAYSCREMIYIQFFTE